MAADVSLDTFLRLGVFLDSSHGGIKRFSICNLQSTDAKRVVSLKLDDRNARSARSRCCGQACQSTIADCPPWTQRAVSNLLSLAVRIAPQLRWIASVHSCCAASQNLRPCSWRRTQEFRIQFHFCLRTGVSSIDSSLLQSW